MSTKLRNGKAYEHSVIGMLTLNGIDFYMPVVDDQAIDGVIRFSAEGGTRYFDVQIKGGKVWSNIRCTVSKLKTESLLFFYNAKKNELIWLDYKKVKSMFPSTGQPFGDIFLTVEQVSSLKKEGYADLGNLKQQLGAL